MTRYAVGDIHGGSKTFGALLEGLNLKHSDRLYLLGDYVDRGNDSRGVLDMIWDLIHAGFDVRPIRGNHDDMFLRTMTGEHDVRSSMWLFGWGEYTLKSFGVRSPDLIPPRYMALLDAMPFIQVEDDFVLVHAALDLSKDDPVKETSEYGMLWGQVGDVQSRRIGGRKLVTGHTIRPLEYIELSMLSSRIFLDNGAFTNIQPSMGNLVGLDLDRMEIIIQPWLDGESII